MLKNQSTTSIQKPAALARISLSATRAAYIGPALHLNPHKNSVATVAIALNEPFTLQFKHPGAEPQVATVEHISIIAPGVLHHLCAAGDMIFIYLNALGDDYRQFKALDLHAARLRLLSELTGLRGTASSSSTLPFKVDQICELLGVPIRAAVDSVMAQVIEQINRTPQDFASVESAACLSGLSVSRFQRRFRQAVGMSFRRYRLWRRMTRVMHCLAQGCSLTTAAHAAGFASSAHLSAAFRTMFGLSPSQLRVQGMRIDFD